MLVKFNGSVGVAGETDLLPVTDRLRPDGKKTERLDTTGTISFQSGSGVSVLTTEVPSGICTVAPVGFVSVAMASPAASTMRRWFEPAPLLWTSYCRVRPPRVVRVTVSVVP